MAAAAVDGAAVGAGEQTRLDTWAQDKKYLEKTGSPRKVEITVNSRGTTDFLQSLV